MTHCTNYSWLFRWVDTSSNLDDATEPYKFVVTVSVMGKHCYLTAAHGEISLSDAREIKADLLGLGYSSASWSRASGKKIEVS